MEERRLVWLSLIANAGVLALVLTLWLRPSLTTRDLPTDVGGEEAALQAQVDMLQSDISKLSFTVDQIDSTVGGTSLPGSVSIRKQLDDMASKLNEVGGSASDASTLSYQVKTTVQDLEIQVQGLCDRLNAC